MNKIRILTIGVLVLANLGFAQDPTPPDKKPKSPIETALDELQAGQRQLGEKLQADFKKLKDLPESEREDEGEKIYKAYQAESEKIGAKAVELCKSEPKSEAGLKALSAALSLQLKKDDMRAVVELISEHHAKSPAMEKVVPHLLYGGGKEADALLKTVLADNPSKNAKGLACYALSARTQKESIKEEFLERCVKEFADVAMEEEKLGSVAERELYAIRNIKVGKTPPDIAGADMDGKNFKLSEYRGKVVVLDFWGYW